MMDSFKLVVKFLERQINEKPDLRTGSNQLDNFLREQFQISVLEKIDVDRLDMEFRQKVSNTLTTNKVPNDISSIYFGLMTLDGDIDDTSLTTIHLTGSLSTPEEDLEWACDVDYAGQDYINLTDFALIDSNLGELEDKGLIEVLIFNGLLNLLLINSVDLVKDLTYRSSLAARQSIWIGTGFDSGDCYVIGEARA